jgi:hypothetical protein
MRGLTNCQSADVIGLPALGAKRGWQIFCVLSGAETSTKKVTTPSSKKGQNFEMNALDVAGDQSEAPIRYYAALFDPGADRKKSRLPLGVRSECDDS